MPLVVEDGSGRSDANSFGSVAGADTYHIDRENSAWVALDQTKKEAALILATDWISENVTEWVGFPAFGAQALPWPRTGIVDANTGMSYGVAYYPDRIKRACYALADEAAKGSLYNKASPYTPRVTEKTIGPITTKYAATSPDVITSSRTFEFLDRILAPLVRSQGFNARLVRA